MKALLRKRRRALRGPQPPPPPTSETPAGTGLIAPERLAALIGGPVSDPALFERALTHRSSLRGMADTHLVSNERLEFLGDAALGFITAEHLHHAFPTKDEGYLTRLRAKLVNGQALARYARSIQLGTLILLSDDMAEAGGRDNPTILADAFEAVIGAVFLDSGLDAARAFIRRTMFDGADLSRLAEQHDNYKSLLLEYAQARGWSQPEYRVVSEEGPSHDKTFTVQVLVQQKVYGEGRASSKKRAEQIAAASALQRFGAESGGSPAI